MAAFFAKVQGKLYLFCRVDVPMCSYTFLSGKINLTLLTLLKLAANIPTSRLKQ